MLSPKMRILNGLRAGAVTVAPVSSTRLVNTTAVRCFVQRSMVSLVDLTTTSRKCLRLTSPWATRNVGFVADKVYCVNAPPSTRAQNCEEGAVLELVSVVNWQEAPLKMTLKYAPALMVLARSAVTPQLNGE